MWELNIIIYQTRIFLEMMVLGAKSWYVRGILKSDVQQNTPDLSVSGTDKNILKIWKQSINEIFQNREVEKK